jgi:hypothetical protein
MVGCLAGVIPKGEDELRPYTGYGHYVGAILVIAQEG